MQKQKLTDGTNPEDGIKNRFGKHIAGPYERLPKHRRTARSARHEETRTPPARHKGPLITRAVWSIVIDIVIAGAALLIFSFYYFLMPVDQSGNAVVLPIKTAMPVSPLLSPKPSDKLQDGITREFVKTAKAAGRGAWGGEYPGKFTDGAVEKTSDTYKSANISVTVEKRAGINAVYYVADIYTTDLKFLKTAFPNDKFGRGIHAGTDVIAMQNSAVIAINGDNCGNNAGPVVRNGILYREEAYRDVLVLYYDGSMQTFTAKQFDLQGIKQDGAWQVWTFGPMLLDNGKPMITFNSTLGQLNPRTAVGYYKPGHYCFVVVDGRQPGYSNGYTLQELSELFYSLGCKTAFNLDGGTSSEMYFMGKFVNKPYNGGRGTSDIVYVADK